MVHSDNGRLISHCKQCIEIYQRTQGKTRDSNVYTQYTLTVTKQGGKNYLTRKSGHVFMSLNAHWEKNEEVHREQVLGIDWIFGRKQGS